MWLISIGSEKYVALTTYRKDGTPRSPPVSIAELDDGPTDELLQLYALEGLLDRLSGSPHADRFVLEGGVLLAAFDARRPTRDVDLAAVDLANDVDEIRALVNEVLSIARADGLEFDPSVTTAAPIRDDVYGGVRTTVHGSLSTFVVQFHIDVNLGDPLWPTPRRSTCHACSAGHRFACAATASS